VNTEHTLHLLKHLLVDMKKKTNTRSSKRKIKKITNKK